MKIRLRVIDKFGDVILLSNESYEHILTHPEMAGQEERIKETLAKPGTIKYSKYDIRTLLYYRFYEKATVNRKYLVVIVKKLGQENFIVTSFYTDKIKAGESL